MQIPIAIAQILLQECVNGIDKPPLTTALQFNGAVVTGLDGDAVESDAPFGELATAGRLAHTQFGAVLRLAVVDSLECPRAKAIQAVLQFLCGKAFPLRRLFWDDNAVTRLALLIQQCGGRLPLRFFWQQGILPCQCLSNSHPFHKKENGCDENTFLHDGHPFGYIFLKVQQGVLNPAPLG